MRIVTFVALALLSIPLFAAEQTGFAKADQPAVASYNPNPALSFNSAGGAITIKRLNVGLYTITFAAIAANMKRSNVQLSDVGSGSEQCSLRSWLRATGTNDFVVSVHCITNTTGVNVDGRWSVFVKIIE
jgi:hypothetical protein